MPAIIGVDVGTTGTKTILADENLAVISSAYEAYGFTKNSSGFVEQNAKDWWASVVHTVRTCVDQYKSKDEIAAICVSSQGASLVCVDHKGEPLANAILWMDTRAEKQGRQINETLGEDYIYRKTGWKAQNCFNFLQILWLRQNQPKLYRQTGKFLSTIEYINFKLSGEYVVDPSNAGICQLFNIVDKKWDNDLLSLCGIDDDKLANVVDSGHPVGKITRQAASELGLSEQVTVYCGGHDQYLAAVGSGAIHNGDVLLSCGTSWGVTCITDTPRFDSHLFYSPGRHVVNGLWGIFAYTPTGGAAYEWLKSTFFEMPGANAYETMDHLAGSSRIGANGLVFLPHFAGSSCPSWIGSAKAAILGLSLSHKPEDIIRAYLEGVGYEIRWMLMSIVPEPVKSRIIKSLGGGSRSRVWMQIVADIVGIDIECPSYTDAPAMGAAMLAGVGCGLIRDIEAACSKIKNKGPIIKSDHTANELYANLFLDYQRKFRQLNL